jgi:hypothetical protein
MKTAVDAHQCSCSNLVVGPQKGLLDRTSSTLGL